MDQLAGGCAYGGRVLRGAQPAGVRSGRGPVEGDLCPADVQGRAGGGRTDRPAHVTGKQGRQRRGEEGVAGSSGQSNLLLLPSAAYRRCFHS